MTHLSALPWTEILAFDRPLEVMVRGTLTYLGLLILLRLVLKRQSGNIASSDILVTVLIADAIQNGMAGDYKSVPDGLLLVGTIVAWDYGIDWLSYRSKALRRLLVSPPLPLVIAGRMQRKHMRRELITQAELWEKLREEGIDNLDDVKRAYLESDGEISVIKNGSHL